MIEIFQKWTMILSELWCLRTFCLWSSQLIWLTSPSFMTLIPILVWPQALPKTHSHSMIPSASRGAHQLPWTSTAWLWNFWLWPLQGLQRGGQQQIFWPSWAWMDNLYLSHCLWIMTSQSLNRPYNDNHGELRRISGPCPMHSSWWDSKVPVYMECPWAWGFWEMRHMEYLVSNT